MINQIKEIINDVLGDDLHIDEDTKLADDLSMDSLDLAELWLEIENYFDITIPDERCEECKTIGDIVEALQEYGVVAE